MEIRKGILCNLGVAILMITLHVQLVWILTALFILMIQILAEDILEIVAKRNKSLSANNRENTLDSLTIELFQTQRNLAATIKINEDSEARGEKIFSTEELESEVERIKASIQELEALPVQKPEPQKPEPVIVPKQQDFYPRDSGYYNDYRQAELQSDMLREALGWTKEDIVNAYKQNITAVWRTKSGNIVEIWDVHSYLKQEYLLVAIASNHEYNRRYRMLNEAINLIDDDLLRAMIKGIRNSKQAAKPHVVK